MRNTTTLLAILVGLTLAPALRGQGSPTAEVEGLINSDSLGAAMEFLSHDLLEGRGPGTRGDALTRLWLRTQMRMAGLEPAGENGSWEQPVRLVGITAKVDTPLTVTGPKGTTSFTTGEDFVTNAGRPDPKTSWDDAEIVFVGYGITAPEQDWDDFKDVDVKGKVLLVMNNDPSSDPGLFAGETRLYYGRWSYKYEEAARRGALGAIVIHTTPSAGYPFQVIQSGSEQEDFWLPFKDGEPTLAQRAWCSDAAARRICELGGFDLDELRAKAEKRDFRPVPLGVTAKASTTNSVRELDSANVLGMIRGSDPELSKTFVVVTAHFDHLGIGPARSGNDTIYNGALDNASGTGAMIEIAKAIMAMKERPKRSILFTAVTAEESGLLGSLHFARNPTVPRRSMVANFNIDGINIYGPTRDIALIGYGKNSLTMLADVVARSRGRVLVANPEVDKGLFYRSDHFSFARIGVPSAYFKAGNDFYEKRETRRRAKLLYTSTKYHQPSDEYRAGWNLEGAVEDTRLILECMVRCANAPTEPTWTPGDEFEKLR